MMAAQWEKQQAQVLDYIAKQNELMVNETKRKEEASNDKFKKLETIIDNQQALYKTQMEDNKHRMNELREVLDDERKDRRFRDQRDADAREQERRDRIARDERDIQDKQRQENLMISMLARMLPTPPASETATDTGPIPWQQEHHTPTKQIHTSPPGIPDETLLEDDQTDSSLKRQRIKSPLHPPPIAKNLNKTFMEECDPHPPPPEDPPEHSTDEFHDTAMVTESTEPKVPSV
jgi:hypothetical protein